MSGSGVFDRMGDRLQGGTLAPAPNLRRRVETAKAAASEDDEFQRKLTAAELAIQRRDLVTAEIHARAAIMRQPLVPAAHLVLGRGLVIEERWGLAGSAVLDAIALGDLSKDTIATANMITARFRRPEPTRFVARATGYGSVLQSDQDGGLVAPMLSSDIQLLARLMLGRDLPGDDACDVQLSEDSPISLLCWLAGRPDFQTRNNEALSMLVETGRVP